ncbi:MAG: glycine cleavage system aminomethyltransferase GcvT [Gammaproteobacteria bacterium]
MERKTPLYAAHEAAGGRMVDFAGWLMPLSYGSELAEHRAVREDAGIFDVSHMGIVDFEGPRTKDFLRRLYANDIARLTTPGAAQYGVMLNPEGGVKDDLITYFRGPERYRTVVNAGTRAGDIAWMRKVATDYGVTVTEREALAMIAVQGPRARERAAAVLPEALKGGALELKPFTACERGDWLVARTGYTGEDGWEIMLPVERAPALWQALVEAGAAPCGLAARDSLRLEAGLNLYGQDMDETTTPWESNLGWTVALEPAARDFIGREALERAHEESTHRLIGLVLKDRGVIRHGQTVKTAAGEGVVTSGGFGPTIERSVALARVPAAAASEDEAQVLMRNREMPAAIVKPPFVRRGKVRVNLQLEASKKSGG